jgi:hypothetical protein
VLPVGNVIIFKTNSEKNTAITSEEAGLETLFFVYRFCFILVQLVVPLYLISLRHIYFHFSCFNYGRVFLLFSFF